MSAAPHCRIGRVRMKRGGTDLHILPDRQLKEKDGRRMVHAARGIARHLEGDFGGYLVLGWTMKGHYSVSFAYDTKCLIAWGLLPSWTAEVVRRELINISDIRHVIDTEYVPPWCRT